MNEKLSKISEEKYKLTRKMNSISLCWRNGTLRFVEEDEYTEHKIESKIRII
jgi:hypothetical protein